MAETKKHTYYKYCLVPSCESTTFKTPNKVFFRVPNDLKNRNKWCKAIRHDIIGPKSTKYVCEDHFDVEEDMENYFKYTMLGGQLKLKKGVLPHKFECQQTPSLEKKIIILRKKVTKKKRPTVSKKKDELEVDIKDVCKNQGSDIDSDPLDLLHEKVIKNEKRGRKTRASKQAPPIGNPDGDKQNDDSILPTCASTQIKMEVSYQEPKNGSKQAPPIGNPDGDKQNDDSILPTCASTQIKMEVSYQEPKNGDPVPFTVRGLVPPVFTPLREDGSIHFSIIPSYAKFLSDAGIKAVLVGGTTGENMSLRVNDRMRVVDKWLLASKNLGLHIMVQVGGGPLADVLLLKPKTETQLKDDYDVNISRIDTLAGNDNAEYCEKAGAHSLLTLPELYFKPQSVDELVSYVELVAKAAPSLPVLYYHIPAMTKVELNMPKFVSAATERIPNFKGIKFTSNDLSEAAQVLRCLEEGQEIFLGADTLLAPAALLGIKSSIGTTFNLFPALAQKIVQAVEINDVQTARKLQERLSLAIEAHTCEGAWVPVMKAGMELVTGIKVGPPSLPQKPLSNDAKARIAEQLNALGMADVRWFIDASSVTAGQN